MTLINVFIENNNGVWFIACHYTGDKWNRYYAEIDLNEFGSDIDGKGNQIFQTFLGAVNILKNQVLKKLNRFQI